MFHYFLIQYKLSSKSSLNCFTTFGCSVCQGSLSWVHTIWHCSLTTSWPTLCHCSGDSLNNSMLITAYYSCLTWRSLGALHNKVGYQSPVKHLVGFETGILPILNATTYPTGPFSIFFNVYESLDYSPLVFNVYNSFLGWFFVLKFRFLIFFAISAAWLVDFQMLFIIKYKSYLLKWKFQPQLLNFWSIWSQKPLATKLAIKNLWYS